ncbi:MAG: transporter substrate-binding domain-containing protein [Spirochaetales bacterium]|uniref:Transporter substrate-binding domain-containing protein n=1 Tax=Candidatus Thalassospirochaeta sargassi TaxID=3119039 RepID=A0AAJ1MLX5_9SPIO|nr:transporter substrate-binding domain-containing protein [Spirochaetales bacterium]
MSGLPAPLTEAELQWIKEHPVIRVVTDPHSAPLEFFENDKILGISGDYLDLITDRTGLNVEIIKTETWSEALDMLKTRDADMNVAMVPTDDRLEYMLFTESFFESDVLIFSTRDNKVRVELDDLIGHRVGIISGYSEDEFLSKVIPDLELIRYSCFGTALADLSLGQLDYFIGDLAFVSYNRRNRNFANIVIAGDIGFKHRLSLAVRSDWPELQSILQKGLDTITGEERSEIEEKWVGLRLTNNYISKSILPYIFITGGLIIILLIIIIIRNRALAGRVTNKTSELNNELEQKEKLLFEVHHRVNNNMQMVMSLLLMGFSDSVVLRMRVLALVQKHGHTNNNAARVRIVNIIKEVISAAADEYDLKQSSTIRIEGDYLCGMKTATDIGLLINEIFINLYSTKVFRDNDCMIKLTASESGKCRMSLSFAEPVLDISVFEGLEGSPAAKLIKYMKKELSAEGGLTSEGYTLIITPAD